MANDPRDDAATLLKHNSFAGRLVTLFIGANKQKFTVHREQLTKSSKFFHAAFERGWQESRKSSITLEDEEPSMIKLYIHFVYTGKLAIKRAYEQKTPREDVHDAEYLLLSNLYEFGDRYQDTALRDAVIDAMIAKSQVKVRARVTDEGQRYFPRSKEVVDILWTSTPPGSPVRKLILDMHVHDGDASWLADKSTNSEFLVDLAKAMYEAREGCMGCTPPTEYRRPGKRNPLFPKWDENSRCWVYTPSLYYVDGSPELKKAMKNARAIAQAMGMPVEMGPDLAPPENPAHKNIWW